jgi:four helix bundle protein
MSNLHHHSLIAWQRADDLFIDIHRLTLHTFPRFERYELGAQLRKAAYSVPANIAEGFARRLPKDRRHFLNIAESSLAEVRDYLHAAHRLEYINDARYSELELQVKRVAAPLPNLPYPPDPSYLPAPPGCPARRPTVPRSTYTPRRQPASRPARVSA